MRAFLLVYLSLPSFLFHARLLAAEALNPSAHTASSRLRIRQEDATWQTWGPYRPGLYFGVRPMVPDTLLMGLMWASGESRTEMLDSLRNTCEQNDGMQGYGWTAYDTRVGGSQTLHDQQLHIDLTTDFLKTQEGDSWAIRVSAILRPDAPANVKTTVILHAAVEKEDKSKSLVCGDQDNGFKRRDNVETTCRGEIPALGSFEFHVVGDGQNKPLHDTAVKSIKVSEDDIWQAKSVFTSQIRATAGAGVAIDNTPGHGNMHFIQMTFEGPFSVTLSYRDLKAPILDANALKSGLDDLGNTLPATIDKVFPRTVPFDQDSKYAEFSKGIISNLLGGLGFFHGDTRVDYSHAPEYEETDLKFWEKAAEAMSKATITTVPPTSLLTHTPSRPFFPRGFLWDEGFHLLPVIEWDLDLAVSVLQSWLNLVDEDGWIGREQIPGPEARSRVPKEFHTQYPHYANPPTLSLLFPILISKLTGTSPYNGHPSIYMSSKSNARSILQKLYPLLARHYNWFRRTQAGNFTTIYPRPPNTIPGEGYRWRGRTPRHCLTSGLDDYPRVDPPHPGELHLDALAWVGASANALQQVSSYLGETADSTTYAQQLSNVKHNLQTLHWSPTQNTYCDATIDAKTNKYTHICRQGYLSLYPLLLGLLNATHPNLPATLDLLSDESKLWSRYGLRSLSASDPGYHQDDDYWRGAVWMNLNVLAVLRMRDVGLEKGAAGHNRTDIQTRALDLSSQLRERLVNTVFRSWESTGFFWEQYSDVGGGGTHSQAFTGWTACVVLLMGLEFEGVPTGDGNGEESAAAPAAVGVGGLVVAAVGVVMAVMAVVYRRKLAAVVGIGMGYFARWRKGGVTMQRYEPVEGIDLDERRGG